MNRTVSQCPGAEWIGRLCLWIEGDAPKGFRRCVERIALGAELRPPFSYCLAHRAVAYVQPEAVDESAAPLRLAA